MDLTPPCDSATKARGHLPETSFVLRGRCVQYGFDPRCLYQRYDAAAESGARHSRAVATRLGLSTRPRARRVPDSSLRSRPAAMRGSPTVRGRAPANRATRAPSAARADARGFAHDVTRASLTRPDRECALGALRTQRDRPLRARDVRRPAPRRLSRVSFRRALYAESTSCRARPVSTTTNRTDGVVDRDRAMSMPGAIEQQRSTCAARARSPPDPSGRTERRRIRVRRAALPARVAAAEAAGSPPAKARRSARPSATQSSTVRCRECRRRPECPRRRYVTPSRCQHRDRAFDEAAPRTARQCRRHDRTSTRLVP